jgi:phosphoribosyl-AMP cyclohydrolase
MLLDCVDILRSITKSCGDNVGGVNKRVWITQLQQIESYTYDSLGYVNSITTKEVGTTNYGYELKKVISKKGSHSGNVEAIENVNVDVFKHTAILKAYATTPEQRDSLVSLYGASKVVVFFETDNGEIEIYGLENGLYATALTGNTGEQMQDDTAFTFTLSGLQTSLPKYFLYGGSLATSIAYLDEIGLNPIYVIQEYSAGISTITFTPDGSDGWDVGIVANPTTLQIPSGETIDSVGYEIKHFVGGTNTGTISGTLTSDDTINTGALGSGTFEISLLYHISDGSEVNTLYMFQVDATDSIIDYCKINGATVNSVSGLDISVSADVNSSVSTTVTWFSFDGGSNFIQVGTGVNATITMPLGAIYVVPVITLGSGFPDYPSNEMSSRFSITIS